MELLEMCLKCNNPQPVFRICSLCDVKTYYFCVETDCWDIKPESPGKKPFWMCYTCKPDPDYNKENEPPKSVNNLSPRKKYSVQILADDESVRNDNSNIRKEIKGKCVGRKNYLTIQFNTAETTNQGQTEICPQCKNAQPVVRTCSNCDSKNYFTCVGIDCWGMKPEPPDNKLLWICYVCKPNYNKEKEEGQKESDSVQLFSITETIPDEDITNSTSTDQINSEDRDYDESEIFDVRVRTQSEVSQTEGFLKSEDFNESGLFLILNESDEKLEQHVEAMTEHQDPVKNLEIDLQSWETLHIQDFSECTVEGAVGGIMKASEEFTRVRDAKIAEEKLAVKELNEQIKIREIEEAMNENLYDTYKVKRFRRLQKFWENVSGGDQGKSEEETTMTEDAP